MMICNKCGTETKDDFCPRCGEQLREGALLSPASVNPPAPNASTAAEKPPAKEQHKRQKRPKPPLRMKMVIWPAIALFLPLAYLFFDAFVLLSDRLFFGTPAGGTYLLDLMECLSDVSFATNTLGELTEATFGEALPLVTAVSPASILPAIAAGNRELLPLLLPVTVTVLLALGCAACGVLLILTAGRILRLRLYRDLTLFAGAAATFAPLLSNLILRVTYCLGRGTIAADELMRRVLPSVESLFIMGILACALLPALAILRGLGAHAERAEEHVGFPFRPLSGASFGFARTVLLGFAAFAVCLAAVTVFLPVTHIGPVFGVGDLKQSVITVWNSVIAGLASLGTDGAAVDHFAFGRDLLTLAAFLGLGFMLFNLLTAFIAWVRVLFIKKERLEKKRGPKRALKDLPEQLRAAMLSCFGCMVVLQAVQVCVLLFLSPVAAHMDFSNATETFNLVYLVMAHVRTLGTTTTLYSFLAAAGMALCYCITQCACVVLNHKNRVEN